MAGDVMVNGEAQTRAGSRVGIEDVLSIKAPRDSLAAVAKLDHGLDRFGIDVLGCVAADFGASTGGFTDCLLQRGAARVYAIDVGYGQLAERLRRDARVVVMDRQNARHLEELPESVDLVSIDVSFIGLRLVLPAAILLLKDDGHIVALVKPQFEAGRGEIGRGGVIRDPEIHRRVLEAFMITAAAQGLGVIGLTASPLRGPAGNVEFLAHLQKAPAATVEANAIDRAIEESPPA